MHLDFARSRLIRVQLEEGHDVGPGLINESGSLVDELDVDKAITAQSVTIFIGVLEALAIAWIIEHLGHVFSNKHCRDHSFEIDLRHSTDGAWVDELNSEFDRVDRFVLLVASSILASDLQGVDADPCQVSSHRDCGARG